MIALLKQKMIEADAPEEQWIEWDFHGRITKKIWTRARFFYSINCCLPDHFRNQQDQRRRKQAEGWWTG